MFRMTTLALLLLFSFCCTAQSKRGRKPSSPYTGTQWWTGVHVGANLSAASVAQQYHVIIPTAENPPVERKAYQSFRKPGFQFGVTLRSDIARWLSVGVMPVYAVYRYNYISTMHWESPEAANKNLRLDFDHTHAQHYLNIPLALNYNIMTRPVGVFLQGGGYYGWLLSGSKRVDIAGVDNASGSENKLDIDSQSADITPALNRKNYGLIFGAGVFFPLMDGRFTATFNYQYGLSDVARKGARFESDQFVTGSYDAIDDLSLRGLSLTVELAIPLKLVTSKDFVPVSR